MTMTMTKSKRIDPGSSRYEIRVAKAGEVGPLPEIEVRASELFAAEDIAPEMRQCGLPLAFFEVAARESRV